MKKRLCLLLVAFASLLGTASAQTYRGMVDVSFNIGSFIAEWGEVCREPNLYASISTTHGMQLSRNHFVGIGLEYSPWSRSTYNDENGFFKKAMPIYAMWRMDFFSTHRCSFFFDLRPGFQVGTPSGVYLGGNAGIRIALTKRSGLNISLGAEMRRLRMKDLYGRWIEPSGGSWTDGAKCYEIAETNGLAGSIRIGIDF